MVGVLGKKVGEVRSWLKGGSEGSEEIGEGELLNIEKYISSQDKEFHDEIWRPPFD